MPFYVFFAVFVYLFWPLKGIEWFMVISAYFLILIAELINTSIERLLEKLHPGRDVMIGESKDIASAAVFLSYSVLNIAIILIALSRFNILPLL